MIRMLASGLIALAMLITGAKADGLASRKGAFVVVVGVEKTIDATIQPRPSAKADAEAVYDLMTDPKYSSIAKDRVIYLSNEADRSRNGQVATREAIMAAVKKAIAETGKDDPIYLFLHGRGASSGDATCFFAADTTFKDRGKTGLLGTDLAVELKKAKEQQLCIVLDVHFKGFDAGKEAIVEPNLSDILKAVYGTDEAGEDSPLPHDRLLMMSAIPGYDPVMKGSNSAFMSVMLDALKGKADKEGYEPDGLVTVDELVTYVEREAANEARTLGKTVKEKESIPYIVGEETSHFIITMNPAVRTAAMERVNKFAKMGKEFPEEVQKSVLSLLNRMPKLKAQQEIRRFSQEFVDGKLSAESFLSKRSDVLASLKITTKDAESYARVVMRASDMLQADYVKKLNGGELVTAGVKGLFRRLEIEMPPAIEEQVKLGKELRSGPQRELLIAVREFLGKREDLDGGKDADITIGMLVASVNDPYTVYYDEATKKKIESSLTGELRGVGIQIRRDLVKDGLLVVSPIKGGPAYAAGIKAGDVITEIRRDVNPKGQPLKDDEPKVISTKGMKTEKALEIILGNVGVPITLVVERENATGPAETMSFNLKRGRVALETVLGHNRNADDSWNYYIDEAGKIAHVTLTQFAPSTAAELKNVMQKLEAEGARGLILDLRYNPGGRLDGAIRISDLFLDEGLIVEIRPRVGDPDKFYDMGFGKFTKIPMAVLINGSSASASEIVSAALQDYGRATIIGERTYGKGSVQNVRTFTPTGGDVKMTTARYFPPLGKNIDKQSTGGKPEEEWGVTPDKGFEVKLSREEKQELAEHFRDREIIPRRDANAPKKDNKAFKDRQLDTALEHLKAKIAGQVVGK
jgi:C-terminal peptidase prc